MNWIASWIIVVAILHTATALIAYMPNFVRFAHQGCWGTVSATRDRVAFWFFVAGLLMLMIGIGFLESGVVSPVQSALLCLITIIGIVLVPRSGFWLLLPPAIGGVLANLA